MKTYIVLLRGINVSGKNIIKMDALKEIFLKLGFGKVQTYIQSGNVIFTENNNISKKILIQLISNKIKQTFQLEIPVLLLEIDELQKIIKELPFINFEEKNIYFTFPFEDHKTNNFNKILEKKSDNENIFITNHVIYLECKNGYGDTKLHNTFLEKKLNIICTTRNLKTCLKLVNLSNSFINHND